MKRKEHKHKKTFHILMISDIGDSGRQFNISQFALRVAVFLGILVVAAVGAACVIAYRLYSSNNARENVNLQLAEQHELVRRLEDENQALRAENATLIAENESFTESAVETEDETDSDIPRRFPVVGRTTLLASYAEDMPYILIDVDKGGSIVAAGSGMVVEITSDETYSTIIEIEHKKNYSTRYMCTQNVVLTVTEGAQVEVGDKLFEASTDSIQLYYQISYDGNPIDPLNVIEAKG